MLVAPTFPFFSSVVDMMAGEEAEDLPPVYGVALDVDGVLVRDSTVIPEVKFI